MKFFKDYFELGGIVPATLIASAFLAIAGIVGYTILPSYNTPVADMRIEPDSIISEIGKTFSVDVIVESSIPVNVFSGEVLFNPNILTIKAIDYNTSIADLWAERPWYSNGNGTLNFTGGTTKKGGFTGTDQLITITFKTLASGNDALKIRGARILQHDGLGTDATLKTPIETFVTINDNTANNQNIVSTDYLGTTYIVADKLPSTDLNGDGKQTISDMSIFMLYLTTRDLRADFNADGSVNTKDLSIIINAR